MDNGALRKISYGLYVLTASDNEKDNGCIVNTVIQAASKPELISICVSKNCYTHDMIVKTGKCVVSVINEKADMELFVHFGYTSGRNTDKFADYKNCERGKDGIYHITEGTNAFLSIKIDRIEDLGSHSMFIGEITHMEVLNDVPSMTYEYYTEKVKQNAPKLEKNIGWRCVVCGYVYENEELPLDFICPICNHPACDFEKIE